MGNSPKVFNELRKICKEKGISEEILADLPTLDRRLKLVTIREDGVSLRIGRGDNSYTTYEKEEYASEQQCKNAFEVIDEWMERNLRTPEQILGR